MVVNMETPHFKYKKFNNEQRQTKLLRIREKN